MWAALIVSPRMLRGKWHAMSKIESTTAMRRTARRECAPEVFAAERYGHAIHTCAGGWEWGHGRLALRRRAWGRVRGRVRGRAGV